MKSFPLFLLLCLTAVPGWAAGSSSAGSLERIHGLRDASSVISERSDLRYRFRLSGADAQASLVVSNPTLQRARVRLGSKSFHVRPGRTLTLAPDQIGWAEDAETVVKMSPGLKASLQNGSSMERLPNLVGVRSYDVVRGDDGSLAANPWPAAVSKNDGLPTVNGGPLPEIGLDETVEGVLDTTDFLTLFDSPAAYADRYRITLAGSRTLQIILRSTTFDAYLSAWDDGFELISDDDDLGGGPDGTDSRIELTLPAGTYIIEASSFEAGETGPYTLTVNDLGPSPDPTPLTLPATVDGVLEFTDTRTFLYDSAYADYFSLDVATALNVTITLRSAAFDAFLMVTDLNRGQTALNDDGGGGENGTDASLTMRLEPGSYFIEASAIDPDSGGPYTLTVEEYLGPFITPQGVVSSASFQGGSVAPGEILSFFGTEIGPAELAGLEFDQKTGLVSTEIGGTRILFDGQAAPMVFAFSGQSSAVAPFSLAGQTQTTIQIEKDGVVSNSVMLPVVNTKPSIFSINQSGMGPGAILNQDFSLNSAENPAAIGSVIQIFLSGGGQTNPASLDGELAPAAAPLAELLADVSVTIGGQPAEVVYGGGAPGLINGLVQVNAVVAEGTPSGDAEIVVTIGGEASQAGVTVSIQ